jgi:rhamnosyltransferase
MPEQAVVSGASAMPDVAVCAVVVTFHPDITLLRTLLDALESQVGHVVVVDNASPESASQGLYEGRDRVEFLPLPENLGLATALNMGIARARAQQGVSHVVLMDQDSVPESGMVAALKTALDYQSQHMKVAAAGPHFRDPREGGDAPFVRIRFPFNRRLRCTADCEVVVCDFLITSGSLIPLAVLDDVGDMDNGLFIDNVDLEWCFRAAKKGYALSGVCRARMLHHHGAERYRVFGLSRGIVVHTSRRLYYMMRNRVLLYRRAYTPVRWIAQDVPRLIVKLLMFGLLVPPRRKNLRCMLAGLKAGIAGRTSPPPEID